MKYTRKDYMSNKCTHREYYGQFVGVDVKSLVNSAIGASKIIKSKDDSFNDIPLKQWDNLAPAIRLYCGRSIADANGTGGISLSDCVCTAKEAAQQIRETA